MSSLNVNVSITGDRRVKLNLIDLASPAQQKKAVNKGGRAALDVIKGYYRAKGQPFWINPALSTHGPGRKRTQWWRDTETEWFMKQQADSSSVSFENGMIGLAHKVTGGTIRAKRKKFLTIPVHPKAHGLDARTFSRTIAPLFQAKGMLMFADKKTGDVQAAYALKKSITQQPWPGALPPEASYLDAFVNEALDSLIQSFEGA